MINLFKKTNNLFNEYLKTDITISNDKLLNNNNELPSKIKQYNFNSKIGGDEDGIDDYIQLKEEADEAIKKCENVNETAIADEAKQAAEE